MSFHLITLAHLISRPADALKQLVVLQWFTLASLKFILFLSSVEFKEIFVCLFLIWIWVYFLLSQNMIVTFINAHFPNLFLFFISFLHLVLLLLNFMLICFLFIVFFFKLFYLINVLGDDDALLFGELARIYVRVIENALVCSLSYFYFIS